MNTFVQTNGDWTYNSNTYEFNANIVSKGSYNGFVETRDYGIRIYNVLSPKSVTCDGVAVPYNVLYFDEYASKNEYYFDGKDMSLTVNCFGSPTNQTGTISITFARDWSLDFKYTSLDGMKGKINRAIQCKAALDESNYQYG
eukprot:261399_1